MSTIQQLSERVKSEMEEDDRCDTEEEEEEEAKCEV